VGNGLLLFSEERQEVVTQTKKGIQNERRPKMKKNLLEFLEHPTHFLAILLTLNFELAILVAYYRTQASLWERIGGGICLLVISLIWSFIFLFMACGSSHLLFKIKVSDVSRKAMIIRGTVVFITCIGFVILANFIPISIIR